MPERFVSQVEIIEGLLRHVSHVIRRRGREILADTGVTSPQLDALVYLKECPDLTMGELGQRMYLACSTATDLCDRLERNGLVARERDQADRRVIRLKITQKGLGIIDKVLEARKRYLLTILSQIMPEERNQLIKSLSRLQILMTPGLDLAQTAPEAQNQ